MVEDNAQRSAEESHNTATRRDPEGEPRHSVWWRIWLIARTIQARLRFVVILVAIGGLIASWDTLHAYFEKWTRPTGETEAASPDLEYFCPMHPYIVRDNPKEKCPICHMDLARRKKGTGQPEALAPGTVSRVQLSPYRVVLAGVRTVEVRRQRLVKEITTYGSVEFNETKQVQIAARQKGKIDKLHVNFTGQEVKKGEELAVLDVRYSPELMATLDDLLRARQAKNGEAEESARKRLRFWDIGEPQIKEFLATGKATTKLTITSPIEGHVIRKYQREGNFVEEGTPLYDVVSLHNVWIEAQVYEADQALLQVGQQMTATTLSLPNEEFTGTLSFIFPHLDENTRTLRVRFELPNPDHKLRPGMYATVKIAIPPARIEPLVRAARLQWCREQAVDFLIRGLVSPGGPGAAAGLAPLLDYAAQLAVLDQGLALAVPENAVIDTGTMRIVYREVAPNTFEGVAVELGPRMTERHSPAAVYAVLHGLAEGDRVVTNGSFLIDAETRLNPSVGSIYFGGTGGKGDQAVVPARPSTPGDVKESKSGSKTEGLR